MITDNIRYIEWQSADEIHKTSKEWLSELLFIKDEHLFFLDLIKMFTIQLIEPDKFSSNRELIKVITNSQKQTLLLIEAIKIHENDLKILVDDVDQISEEKAYVKEHMGLMAEINDYLTDYKELKTHFFNIIKSIKKSQKRIIDKP
ncbi:hypothetical protein [Psychroserpens sp.]|uniref:hypothetical protein n=1 Tax=Psychroserpens sp. TaxID=2020870 RepID=UPI0038591ACC